MAPRDCGVMALNVIASQRVARMRPMTGSAKQSSFLPFQRKLDCFVASLLAMTLKKRRPYLPAPTGEHERRPACARKARPVHFLLEKAHENTADYRPPDRFAGMGAGEA